MYSNNAPLGSVLKLTPQERSAKRRAAKIALHGRFEAIRDERRARQNYNNMLRLRGLTPRATLKRNPKGSNVRLAFRRAAVAWTWDDLEASEYKPVAES